MVLWLIKYKSNIEYGLICSKILATVDFSQIMDSPKSAWLSSCFSSQALSTESVERLPVYNKAAWKHYNTNHEADDWCVPSREPKDMTTFRSA